MMLWLMGGTPKYARSGFGHDDMILTPFSRKGYGAPTKMQLALVLQSFVLGCMLDRRRMSFLSPMAPSFTI
jgi:hypothetical protein